MTLIDARIPLAASPLQPDRSFDPIPSAKTETGIAADDRVNLAAPALPEQIPAVPEIELTEDDARRMAVELGRWWGLIADDLTPNFRSLLSVAVNDGTETAR